MMDMYVQREMMWWSNSISDMMFCCQSKNKNCKNDIILFLRNSAKWNFPLMIIHLIYVFKINLLAFFGFVVLLILIIWLLYMLWISISLICFIFGGCCCKRSLTKIITATQPNYERQNPWRIMGRFCGWRIFSNLQVRGKSGCYWWRAMWNSESTVSLGYSSSRKHQWHIFLNTTSGGWFVFVLDSGRVRENSFFLQEQEFVVRESQHPIRLLARYVEYQLGKYDPLFLLAPRIIDTGYSGDLLVAKKKTPFSNL